MTATDHNGGELLERLAAGERLALLRVTRLVTSRLRRLGAYDLRDEWEDICQEVVWALIRAQASGGAPAPEKVVAYINRTTWNHFVNYLRKRGAAPDSTAGRQEDGFDRLDCRVEAASGDTAGEHTRLAARRALAGLSPQWQALLISHYLEGDPVRTLVKSSGRSRATVNRELRRAREAFRDLFTKAGGEHRALGPAAEATVTIVREPDHGGSER